MTPDERLAALAAVLAVTGFVLALVSDAAARRWPYRRSLHRVVDVGLLLVLTGCLIALALVAGMT